MWPTWKILPGKCRVASARREKTPWASHTTWQITLGSLHLIIHFNAHLVEEAEEMEKCILLSHCFVTFFPTQILQFHWRWNYSPSLLGWYKSANLDAKRWWDAFPLHLNLINHCLLQLVVFLMGALCVFLELQLAPSAEKSWFIRLLPRQRIKGEMFSE